MRGSTLGVCGQRTVEVAECGVQVELRPPDPGIRKLEDADAGEVESLTRRRLPSVLPSLSGPPLEIEGHLIPLGDEAQHPNLAIGEAG